MKIKELIALLQEHDPENEAVLQLFEIKQNSADRECLGVVHCGEPLYGKLVVVDTDPVYDYDTEKNRHDLLNLVEKEDKYYSKFVRDLETGKTKPSTFRDSCDGTFYRTFYKRYVRMLKMGFRRIGWFQNGSLSVYNPKEKVGNDLKRYTTNWFNCYMKKG